MKFTVAELKSLEVKNMSRNDIETLNRLTSTMKDLVRMDKPNQAAMKPMVLNRLKRENPRFDNPVIVKTYQEIIKQIENIGQTENKESVVGRIYKAFKQAYEHLEHSGPLMSLLSLLTGVVIPLCIS